MDEETDVNTQTTTIVVTCVRANIVHQCGVQVPIYARGLSIRNNPIDTALRSIRMEMQPNGTRRVLYYCIHRGSVRKLTRATSSTPVSVYAPMQWDLVR